jgi:tetratricopeptide (TPR) repeat protein
MSAELGESAPHIPAGQSREQHRPYTDTRDLTPFRKAVVRTPVRGLAGNVGGVVVGLVAGRAPGTLAAEGGVPRLGKVGGRAAGKTAKAVHAAIFGSTDPDPLITLARTYPGWSGLCYLMAGLLAYAHGGHLRASELLQHGLSLRNDVDANRYAAVHLAGVVTRVEVAERIEVPVLFSEEAVFLALSHSLRETGQAEAALAALAGLPPSLPLALARCSLAAELGRDVEVVADTEGLLNADDLAAALLLVRARSLRRLGAYGAARAALQEVLRRRKTDFTLRSDALTDRALLLLDAGRKTLGSREWQRRKPAEVEAVKAIRKDAEMHELWDREYGRVDDD